MLHLSCHNCLCNFLLPSGHNHPGFCHHSLWTFHIHIHIHILQVDSRTCHSHSPGPHHLWSSFDHAHGPQRHPLWFHQLTCPRGPRGSGDLPDCTFMALMASEACCGLVKLMKPKPRDHWVSRSLTKTTSEIGLKLLKWSSRACSSVLKLSPPTKSFPSSEDMAVNLNPRI